MNPERMIALLQPYLEAEVLPPTQVEQLTRHLDLLLKWNARMNLTSVRDPEQIVTRHFGESIYAARILFPDAAACSTLVDVGSGAGFPGLPIAVVRPKVQVRLLEAHGKKATFLKEVIRGAGVANATVFQGRAEAYEQKAKVVTLRAVEDFGSILPVSAAFVEQGGRLAALIGAAQVTETMRVLGESWNVSPNVYFPGSTQRVLFLAEREL